MDDNPSRSRRTAGATSQSRSLRQAGNDAEALLWIELKARRLGGYRFVRQFPIGPYFADFLCRSQRLVVEIDGSQHADSSRDRIRDDFMSRRGYSVLRLWTADVMKSRRKVCETILAALDGRLAGLTVASDLRYLPAKPDLTP